MEADNPFCFESPLGTVFDVDHRRIAEIEGGKVDAIVVWSLDRLHRRPLELERFIDVADRHHLSLGSVGGEVDLGAVLEVTGADDLDPARLHHRDLVLGLVDGDFAADLEALAKQT